MTEHGPVVPASEAAAVGHPDAATDGPDLSADDLAAVAAQLGRTPRAVQEVAHRCGCGLPDVIRTRPRLPGGAPFPTLYYLTCPRAASAIGRLEASGLMREMTERLAVDEELAAAYAAAWDDYRARRDAIERLPGDPMVGGMPGRVKCLHVLVAHELAVPGANPLGREALDLLPDWGAAGPCVRPGEPEPPRTRRPRRPAPAAEGQDQEHPGSVGPGSGDAATEGDGR